MRAFMPGHHPVNSAIPTRLVWLFDIDGTLLVTDGAARNAFARAVGERFRGRDPLGKVAFAGRVETAILRDILALHEAEFTREEEAQFWDAVFDAMRAELTPGRGKVLPGVEDLLDELEREPAWARALLTGNMSEMARIKLGHFGLGHRFAFGAFGEEAEDRNALARVAVTRAYERFGVPPERCVVVGDTEHDIACARAVGALAVAVATGSQPADVLAAHGPDLLLESLRDPRPLIDWARSLESRPSSRPVSGATLP